MKDGAYLYGYECLGFGIDEKKDGSQKWLVTLLVRKSLPTGSDNLTKIFTGFGENWQEICGNNSYPVGDRDLIARLNSIASEKALELIPVGSDD